MRKARRAKQPDTFLEALRELSRQVQPLAAKLKEVRARLRHDCAQPLAALQHEHKEKVITARKASPLWFCNANAILDSFNRARVRAMKDNGELRFHAFTGEGRFTVQLIGGRSVADVTGYRCSQVRIDLTRTSIPGRGGRPRERLAIAISMSDRQPRLLTFPLIYDRPLPAEAAVQDVTVTRKRVGTRFQYHAVFRLRLPARPFAIHPRPERRCAINLGFRQRPNGTLRVGMLTDDRGAFRELTLPAGVLHILGRVEDLRAARDTHLDAIVRRLRTRWPDRPAGASAELTEQMTALLHRPRIAARRLAALGGYWRETLAEYWPESLAELDRWRRADKRAYEREANERNQILSQRLEYYRQLARELTQEFGEIRIGKLDLKALVKLEKASGEENELHATARRNRTRAALSELQDEIRKQAVKSGSTLIRIEGPYNAHCYRCGQSVDVAADLMVSCTQGHIWDQDELAALNIFTAPHERFYEYEDSEERSRKRKQAVVQHRERMARMAAGRKAKRSRAHVEATNVQRP
jgi:hypothetical protein